MMMMMAELHVQITLHTEIRLIHANIPLSKKQKKIVSKKFNHRRQTISLFAAITFASRYTLDLGILNVVAYIPHFIYAPENYILRLADCLNVYLKLFLNLNQNEFIIHANDTITIIIKRLSE